MINEKDIKDYKDNEHVQPDPVNHPKHYTSHPAKCSCGKSIECVQITEHMPFLTGNAFKYIWRGPYKGSYVQDLEKAIWYLKRELEKQQEN